MLQIQIGELIRHKRTREPFLVIEKTTQGLMVISLEERKDPADVKIILTRVERDFEPDIEFVDLSKQEAKTIKENMSIIDSVQQIMEDVL